MHAAIAESGRPRRTTRSHEQRAGEHTVAGGREIAQDHVARLLAAEHEVVRPRARRARCGRRPASRRHRCPRRRARAAARGSTSRSPRSRRCGAGPARTGRARAISHDLVAVDDLAALVDRDDAVGVAVEREADVGAVLDAPLGADRSGCVEPQSALMLRPSGSALSTTTSAPSGPQRTRAGVERGAVRAVEHDAQARERVAPRARRSTCATYSRAAIAVRPLDGRGRSGADARIVASSCSMRASTSSGSLRPPGASSFTPLSDHGLWLAEITAAAAPSTCARNATPGVDSTPTAIDPRPFGARAPATSAASMRGARLAGVAPDDERRRGRAPRAAARPSAVTSSSVRSVSASPRTPSVPNRSTGAARVSASSTAAPCGPS